MDCCKPCTNKIRYTNGCTTVTICFTLPCAKILSVDVCGPYPEGCRCYLKHGQSLVAAQYCLLSEGFAKRCSSKYF